MLILETETMPGVEVTMHKTLIMSSSCRECVFYRKTCVLGHKRPWNSMTCDDYQPYCLVCSYSGEFCNTCRILASRRLKPLEVDTRPTYRQLNPIHFDCVWQLPQMSQ